jgi:MFS family permease
MRKYLKPFIPFKYQDFLYFWLTVSSCLLGFWMQRIGATWVMSSMTHSPFMVSLVESCVFLPTLIFSIVGGHFSDTINRSAYLAVVIAVMIIISFLLALVTHLHLLTPALLLIFVFLLGCGSALRNPALSTELSVIVPVQDRKQAVALDNMSFDLARILGPAMGGILLGYYGPSLLFLLNGLLSVGAAFLFFHRYKKQGFLADKKIIEQPNIQNNWKSLFKKAIYRNLLIKSALFFSCSNVIWSFLPLIIMQRFNQNTHEYGLLFSAFGMGSIFGGLLYAYLSDIFSADVLVNASYFLYACALMAIAQLSSYPALVIAFFFAGIGLVFVGVTLSSLVMDLFSESMRGKALSVYFISQNGSLALATPFWGMIASLTSISLALSLVSGFLLLMFVLGVFVLKLTPANVRQVHEGC